MVYNHCVFFWVDICMGVLRCPMTKREIPVIINPDGSVYPFMLIFEPGNEVEDELLDAIKDHLESKGRKLGTFYRD